jgi:hypothetical protein
LAGAARQVDEVCQQISACFCDIRFRGPVVFRRKTRQLYFFSVESGYGWSSDVNLKFFESSLPLRRERYPVDKKAVQQGVGEQLSRVSNGMASIPAIVKPMDNAIAKKVFDLPGLWDFLDVDSLDDKELKDALLEKKKSL